MVWNEPINLNRVYTFDEAVEYMKIKDKEPTKIGKTIRWINVKTGKQVVIEYNS
jgi:hypothetical protein